MPLGLWPCVVSAGAAGQCPQRCAHAQGAVLGVPAPHPGAGCRPWGGTQDGGTPTADCNQVSTLHRAYRGQGTATRSSLQAHSRGVALARAGAGGQGPSASGTGVSGTAPDASCALHRGWRARRAHARAGTPVSAGGQGPQKCPGRPGPGPTLAVHGQRAAPRDSRIVLALLAPDDTKSQLA